MKRFALIGFAVLLIAAAIGLFLLARAPARPAAVPAKAAASELQPQTARAVRPDLPAERPADEPVEADSTADRLPSRTYVREDGVVVVDRRRNPGVPDLTAAINRPPSLALFTSSAVLGVRQMLYPEIRRCSKDIASGSERPTRRVRADVLASSTAGTLAIESLTLKAGSNVSAEELAAIESCARNATIGRSLAVEGQKDLTGGAMSIELSVY